jgi:hypothetical protein
MRLYHEAVLGAGTPDEVGAQVVGLWDRFDRAKPATDFTEVYRFVRNRADKGDRS